MGKALGHESFDVIYSSDLARCVETTQAILAFHSGVPAHYLELIREQDQGSYVGKLVKEVDWDNLPIDVETPERVFERANKFLDLLKEKHMDQNVLVVGHRRFNHYLINVLLKREVGYLDSRQMMYNAALSTFLVTESGVEVGFMNSIVSYAQSTD